MNMEKRITWSSLGNPNILKKVLGYLDYESLRQAEDVCSNWKSAISNGKLWGKLYERNIQLPDWKKMEQALKLKNSTSSLLPYKEGIEYPKEISCQIGDSIKKLEANWSNGNFKLENYPINTTPTRKKTNEVIDFSMNQHWIVRAMPDGRIGMRNRWAPEEEQVANFFRKDNSPFDRNPFIKSVECNESNILVTVGLIGIRKIIFVFEVKEQDKSLLLRNSAWRVIENQDIADNRFNFDSKSCIRLKGDLLLLCGKKRADLSTVVSLMNMKTLKAIFNNKEVPSKKGTVVDFSSDNGRIILFFGRKETSKSPEMDRFLIQIRDSATFLLLQSFTLPLTRSGKCHFDYARGFIVTGSNDSHIRIWNVENATCDGNFPHGAEKLSFLKIVADRLIITCDDKGNVKLWNMYWACHPYTRNLIEKKLMITLQPPSAGETLCLKADEFQILLVLKCKIAKLFLMDFM